MAVLLYPAGDGTLCPLLLGSVKCLIGRRAVDEGVLGVQIGIAARPGTVVRGKGGTRRLLLAG
jgi:hypothetical protein